MFSQYKKFNYAVSPACLQSESRQESLVSEAICDAEVAYQVFSESKYYQYIPKFACQLGNGKYCSKTMKMKKPS